MLLTTCSAEPYPFHKRQLQSNVVLILGPLLQVRTKFFRGKWCGRTIILGILSPGPISSPDQNFHDSTTTSYRSSTDTVIVPSSQHLLCHVFVSTEDALFPPQNVWLARLTASLGCSWTNRIGLKSDLLLCKFKGLTSPNCCEHHQ